jgi:phosphoribosyl-dephospho-CoA transferase
VERVSLRPHDLVRLAPGAPGFADAPVWVAEALRRAPFVVMRRAPRQGDAVAVGVRGTTRGERFGTWLDPRHIESVLTPEKLSAHQPAPSRKHLPVFALLRAVAPLITNDWGPAGSAGFELASGMPTVTAQSDLDIVIRAPVAIPRDKASALFDALSEAAQSFGTRIDIQMETPEAAFSLAEFARASLRVMLRHIDGPRLAADPWSLR